MQCVGCPPRLGRIQLAYNVEVLCAKSRSEIGIHPLACNVWALWEESRPGIGTQVLALCAESPSEIGTHALACNV